MRFGISTHLYHQQRLGSDQLKELVKEYIGKTIQVSDLTKRFGRFTAVDRVSLHVPNGEIHGFLGPNGAGKTTTMRIVATLDPPTAGDALVVDKWFGLQAMACEPPL